MYNTIEYTYDVIEGHLKDREAIEAFKEATRRHPDAIVILDDLSCGHWDIKIYDNDAQKQGYYKMRLSKLYNQVLNRFKR